MTRHPYLKILLGVLAVVVVIAGCGGEGGSSRASLPVSVATISWNPPVTTMEDAAIDPFEELDYYEIHISTDGTLSEEDLPFALVSAVEVLPSRDGQSFTKALIKEFDLNLLWDLPPTNPLYVSLVAVGTDRQKSAFMEPVVWTRW